MIGICECCKEEFVKSRKDKRYCSKSCVTMACYIRNGYIYVDGSYKKVAPSNSDKEVFKKSNKENKKMNKKIKGIDRKIDELKDLIEKGQKATSGLLTVAMGTIIAKLAVFAVKKVFGPGSLPATQDDVDSLKKQNDEISEQNRRLIKYLDEKDQINSFL
jgi:hypothetical protein